MTDRIGTLKTALWTLVGVLAAVTVVRFAHGLGAVTHLSDAAPWGLWIGFDVMSGVALAAGGFVLAAAVHVFGMERYRPFVRSAVLTALLGYAAVAVGLLYDLGLPWRIWHPAVHWQYRSVLFEVALCVMLYLTVLVLEFAPVVLEHRLLSGHTFQVLLRGLKKATLPLVITGIVLSTLHQSSLGSLFLITPYRLHPLWYSRLISLLFFVSAVGLGLMMVVLESLLAVWFLGHRVHRPELAGLGVAASVVLWIYVALRLGDLAHQGVLAMAVDGSRAGNLFLFELAVSAVAPATLLLFRRVRSTLGGMALSASLTVAGMVLYRLDVSILAFARPEGFGYVPSWEEIAVSVGIVSAFALTFIALVERLRVYDDVGAGARQPETAASTAWRPGAPEAASHDPATLDGLLPEPLAAPRRYSAAAVAGAVVAMVFLPVAAVEGPRVPVSAARTVDGVVLDIGAGAIRSLRFAGTSASDPEAGPGGPTATLLLLIDGNRDGQLVLFDHDDHAARLGADTSCATCHHISLPLDRNSSCAACHRDMYDTTRVFDHAVHVDALEGNAGCVECHPDGAAVKTYATATACARCHAAEVRASRIVAAPEERWRAATSYTDAMHHLCVACHHVEVHQRPDSVPAGLDECRACHDADRIADLRRLAPTRGATATPGAAAPAGAPSGEED